MRTIYTRVGHAAWMAWDRLVTTVKQRDDRGLGTLEVVIITLGLMAVAALFVAALTAAVNGRLEKIK